MRIFPILALIVLTTGVAAAENPDLNRQNVAAFFDTAFSVQQKDHEIVGAVVSVVHDGEVLFKAGYGFADLEIRTPANRSASATCSPTRPGSKKKVPTARLERWKKLIRSRTT